MITWISATAFICCLMQITQKKKGELTKSVNCTKDARKFAHFLFLAKMSKYTEGQDKGRRKKKELFRAIRQAGQFCFMQRCSHNPNPIKYTQETLPTVSSRSNLQSSAHSTGFCGQSDLALQRKVWCWTLQKCQCPHKFYCVHRQNKSVKKQNHISLECQLYSIADTYIIFSKIWLLFSC